MMNRRQLFLMLLMVSLLCLLLFSCADDPSTSSGQADDDDDNTDDDDSDDDNADSPSFQVGFSKIDISPWEDLSLKLAGYGSFFLFEGLCRWSTGIHDPLYAHAVAFEDEKGQAVVMIVLDTVGVITNEVVRIQAGVATAVGIEEKSVVVASTHTHHGPDTIGLWGLIIPPKTGRDDNYLNMMVQGAIESGVTAWNNRVPAQISIAVGEHTKYHFNKNKADPNRALDSTMTLLAAYDQKGDLIGTIMNWAAHPTVMDYKNTEISSDYPGAYYRIMEKELGGIHMFVNGAIGAVQPYDPNTDGLFENPTWDDVDLVGGALAKDAMNLITSGQKLDDTEIWLLKARPLQALVENFLFYLAALFDIIPREIPPVGQYGETYITTFAIGPVGFGTIPGEYIPDYSFAMREIMGGDAQFIIGLGMDWIGYAITPDQYVRLAYIYERFLCPSRWAGEELISIYEQIWEGH